MRPFSSWHPEVIRQLPEGTAVIIGPDYEKLHAAIDIASVHCRGLFAHRFARNSLVS